MTAAWERLLEAVLRATVLIAVAMLVHGTVLGENPGCMNNMCKDINVVRYCVLDTDSVRKYITCLPCKISPGRCNTGNANTRKCNQKTQMQQRKNITTTLICDCPDEVFTTPYAERSGTYTDDNWSNSLVKQYLCGDS